MAATDTRLSQKVRTFIEATTPEEQKAATDKIQAHAIDEVSYIPLGEYNFPQARRAVLVDMPPTAVPVFWGVKKTEE